MIIATTSLMKENQKLCFQNVFHPLKNVKPAFSNSSSLYTVQENHCFRDGFVWTLGLTVKFLSVDGI